jgi:hypothetical protein
MKTALTVPEDLAERWMEMAGKQRVLEMVETK